MMEHFSITLTEKTEFHSRTSLIEPQQRLVPPAAAIIYT